MQTTQNIKLGGLGANVGGEDWEKAKRKKEAIQEYAKNLRMQNTQKPPVKRRETEDTREKTAREKALEFAKNVPKPKKKVENINGEDNNNNNNGNQDLRNIIEEDFDENGNTLVGNELMELNLKHE